MLVSGKEFIGKNPKFLKAVEFAQNVAVTKSPVLLVGEHGSGKRTLCKFIHQHSARKEKPFLVVDCASDPESVQNEILGYRDEDGKFHKGLLERANGGMVVFANIDALDENFQKKLFTILSELSDYDLDIRTVATTSKNLSKYVGVGRFYRALFSYFSGTPIFVPALRDRKEDIVDLSHYYVSFFAKKFSIEKAMLTEDAIEKLVNCYWTQNIEELETVLEAAIKNCQDGIVDMNAVELGEKKTEGKTLIEEEDTFKLMSLRDAEMLLIKKALIHTSENRTQAAKILGVSIRTLRNKINEYRTEGNQYFVNLR